MFYKRYLVRYNGTENPVLNVTIWYKVPKFESVKDIIILFNIVEYCYKQELMLFLFLHVGLNGSGSNFMISSKI